MSGWNGDIENIGQCQEGHVRLKLFVIFFATCGVCIQLSSASKAQDRCEEAKAAVTEINRKIENNPTHYKDVLEWNEFKVLKLNKDSMDFHCLIKMMVGEVTGPDMPAAIQFTYTSSGECKLKQLRVIKCN
jgi:hypothetical protein